MDTFTVFTTTSTSLGNVTVSRPLTDEDSSKGTSGSCVVCRTDTDVSAPTNEDSSKGTSGSCVIA
jgi:hypothetical protein